MVEDICMIFLMGDLHGRYELPKIGHFLNRFPELKFTKSDYFIVLGDFGIPWNKRDLDTIDMFKRYPFTTLFIEGNHDNDPLLNSFPIKHKFGGRVNALSKTLFRLRRGEIYNIEEKSIFTFGGAYSVDKYLRTEGISWWPEEEFNEEERSNALINLETVNYKVDYVLTHAMPTNIKAMWGFTQHSRTEKFLSYLNEHLQFEKWYSGHYHVDKKYDKYRCLYDDIIPLGV